MQNFGFTNELLDKARQQGDLQADNFISDAIKRNELSELNSFFKSLMYNNQFQKDNIPSEFLDYISLNSKLPSWTDFNKIEIAQNAFKRIGPEFVVAYFCKSLPECYACGKGAEVLYKTGRLTQHTRRRVAQTAQFVLDVMTPGGLDENGRGIATALKVRVMHASIRYYFMRELKNGKLDYNTETSGLPINQEDLLGTLLAFSCVVIQGIEKIGIKISDVEKESILHLWKCVGFLIGIDEKLMPENYGTSVKIWELITTRHFEQSVAGSTLTNILVEFLDEILKEKFLDDVIPVLMTTLMGEKVMKILEVRTPKYYNPISIVTFVLGILLLNLESKGFLSRIASRYINLKLLYGLEKYIAEGEDTGIYIPRNLRDDWNIENPVKSIFSGR
jgi:hypothetical protein